MVRCLNLTKGGEYAIAALARLASGRRRLQLNLRPVPVEVLAREQGIPRSFLSKVLSLCARAGIIHAKKGPRGGIVLARSPEKISLLSIIEACEGVYGRQSCVFYQTRPCAGPDCGASCPLRGREEGIRRELGRVTLADMAAALRRHAEFSVSRPL